MKLERGFFVCLWTHAFDSTKEFLTHLQGWGRCWFSVWNRNAKIYLQYFCLYQHRISRAGAIWRQIEHRDHVHAGVSLSGEALPRVVPLCVCVSGHQVFGCVKGVYSLVPSTPFSLVPKLCGMPPYPPVVRSDVICLTCEMKVTEMCPPWSEKWDQSKKHTSARHQNKPGLPVLADKARVSPQGPRQSKIPESLLPLHLCSSIREWMPAGLQGLLVLLRGGAAAAGVWGQRRLTVWGEDLKLTFILRMEPCLQVQEAPKASQCSWHPRASFSSLHVVFVPATHVHPHPRREFCCGNTAPGTLQPAQLA